MRFFYDPIPIIFLHPILLYILQTYAQLKVNNMCI